tara:strand:- start:62 stop:409 length:348 start_codon:yes stop_codon:yes gene_type:complete
MKSQNFKFLAERFSSPKRSGFMFNTKVHFLLALYISEENGKASYESICLDIPYNTASRGTIQNILIMGIELGIFIKIEKYEDKRVKLYSLSEKAQNDMDDFLQQWYLILKNNLEG